MFFRRSSIKAQIYGTVFMDENENGIREEVEAGVSGIKIKLFSVQKAAGGSLRGDTKDIEVYSGRLIAQTATDDSGKYAFYVPEGQYSVSVDLDSLPRDKGVVQEDLFIDKMPATTVDFALRDIWSIEIHQGLVRETFSGDELTLNATVKDKKGNILAARVDFSPESSGVDFEANRFRLRDGGLDGKKINIKASAGSVYSSFPVEFKVPELNSIDKVKSAHKIGLIDQHSRILNLSYCLFDKSKLPKQFRSDIPVKSGTTAMEEVTHYLQSRDADDQTVQAVRGYMSLSVPNLDKEYISPKGYFKIHYTMKGDHAVSAGDANGNGVPDYIEAMGEAFDHVRAVTCNSRGFRTPVLDKGEKFFDVYVYDLQGKYGVTVSNNIYREPNSKSRIASCYISIDNNYSSSKGFKKGRDDCMKVTAAHEFFHAVQYAYNLDASTWWKEASATWNEDEIYDGINDYIQYLGSVFSSPQKSLEENSYGGVAFVKYVSEKWGGYDTVKRIWEVQASGLGDSVNAIDRTIRERFSKGDIGSAYNGFTACNFNPSQYYKEGKLWTVPVALQNTYTAYPVKSQRGKLNHLAANYQLFKSFSPEQGKTLRIIIDGQDKIRWGFKIQKRKKSDNLCETAEIQANGLDNRAEIICRSCGDTYGEVCLIPANLEKEQDRVTYTYSARFE